MIFSLAAIGVSACAQGSSSADDAALTTSTPGPEAGALHDASTHDGGANESGTLDAGQTGDTNLADATSSTDAALGDAGVVDAANAPETGPTLDAGSIESGSTCAAHGLTGALVTFALANESGSETDAAATTAAIGITATPLSRSSALTATSGGGSINASNWGTAGTADASRYYAFTLTPSAGCALAITSMSLDVRASATGPSNGDVATSIDGFNQHFGAFAGTSTSDVSFASVGGTGAIEVRIYGYGAAASAGTLRIQNTMTVSGTIN